MIRMLRFNKVNSLSSIFKTKLINMNNAYQILNKLKNSYELKSKEWNKNNINNHQIDSKGKRKNKD